MLVALNVKINNMPHGTWLNYFQNLQSQADETFNMQASLHKNKPLH
jgi:hypothetical protein